MKFTVEEIARVSHEACAAYQRMIGQEYPHLSWLQVTKETRECTIRGVELVFAGKTPAEIHADWVEMRKGQGWQWGHRKSDVNRTHPNMVPYDQLPEAERYKNEIHAAVIRALAQDLDGEAA